MNNDYSYRYYNRKAPKCQAYKRIIAIIVAAAVLILAICIFFGRRSYKNSFIIKDKYYYAIVMNENTDYNTALINSQSLKLKGGAGYIIKETYGGELVYKVLGCIYSSHEQYLKVAERMKSGGIFCAEYSVCVSGIRTGKKDKEERALIKGATDFIDEFFVMLEKLYTDIDKGEISEGAAGVEIASLSKSVTQRYKLYMNSDMTGEYIFALYDFFYRLSGKLNELNTSLNKFLYTVEVKFMMLELIFAYRDLCGILNN